MKHKLKPSYCLMLIMQGTWTLSHAESCNIERAYIGTESINTQVGNSLWQDDAFRNNLIINTYASANLKCKITSSVSLKTNAVIQHAYALNDVGMLDGKKDSGVALLNEAYLTVTPSDKIFIDIGKIKRRNGYLFSANPLDLLRNTSGNLSSTVKVDSANKYSFYNEGSIGLVTTIYADQGTFELAALPQLTTHHSLQESAVNWSALERTNAINRFYLAATSNKLSDFNPTLVILSDERYNSLGVGTSGYLSDNLILSVEGAVAKGQRWRHLNMDSAQAIRNYQRVDDPFYQDKSKLTLDVAIGLRYTDTTRTEYGFEYYGQSQGYSHNEWKSYFNTVNFINGGYAQNIPAYSIPSLAPSYYQYSTLFPTEVDNANRAGNLLGKHYATFFINSKKNNLHEWDWTGAITSNLRDQSFLLNLNFTNHVTDSIETYMGSSLSLGPKKRSEFGQFGNKGYFYAGFRFIM